MGALEFYRSFFRGEGRCEKAAGDRGMRGYNGDRCSLKRRRGRGGKGSIKGIRREGRGT